jgi:hypothetical protein
MGGLADDRGRFKSAHRPVDTSGAAEPFSDARLQAAEIQAAINLGETVGVVGDDVLAGTSPLPDEAHRQGPRDCCRGPDP